MVTGIDLVDWQVQLQVPGLSPPNLTKSAYTPSGWAIEARINAEVPSRDFAPSSGILGHVAWPSGEPMLLDFITPFGGPVVIMHQHTAAIHEASKRLPSASFSYCSHISAASTATMICRRACTRVGSTVPDVDNLLLCLRRCQSGYLGRDWNRAVAIL